MTSYIRRHAQRKKWALIAVAASQKKRCKKCLKHGHLSQACNKRDKSRDRPSQTPEFKKNPPAMAASKCDSKLESYSDMCSSTEEIMIEQNSTDSSDVEGNERYKRKIKSMLSFMIRKDLNVKVKDAIKISDGSCKYLVVDLLLKRPTYNKKREAPSSDGKRKILKKKRTSKIVSSSDSSDSD